MDSCIFCSLIRGDIPSLRIYDDEFVFAFLDIHPINPGHVLIIPKEHYQNLYDMPDELLKEFAPRVKKLAIAVKKATGADGINIGQNNDEAAGQAVLHYHVHIIPRFLNDGYVSWQGKSYPNDSDAQVLIQKIKDALL